MKKHPFVNVSFTTSQDTVEVTFSKELDYKDKLLTLLREPLPSSQIAKALGVSKPTALKLIKEYIEAGLVKEMGHGRAKKYMRK